MRAPTGLRFLVRLLQKPNLARTIRESPLQERRVDLHIVGTALVAVRLRAGVETRPYYIVNTKTLFPDINA